MFNTSPNPHYKVSPSAFENNPYHDLAKITPRGKSRNFYKIRMRLFEAIKHIFGIQGYVSRKNYQSLGSHYNLGFSTAIGLYNEHIANGWLTALNKNEYPTD